MTFTAPKQFDLAAVVMTFILGWYIQVSYADWESERAEQQRQHFSVQQVTWAEESDEQALADQKTLLDRQNADQAEEQRALGSPLEAAIKNPDLDIRQMLEQVADACLPAGAKAVVTVNGFTEFEVAIELPRRLTPEEIAATAWRIISHTRPYLKTLRFILGDDVLVDLNDADIETLTK
jgi:hypothetical protein